MSIFLEKANSATADELKSQGAVSAAIKHAGTHDVIIEKMYETDGGTWRSMTIEFVTPEGETARYQGFFGVPKSTDQTDIDKAEAQTARVVGDIARFVKAAGLPDIKAAAQGAVTESDDKGRTITVFPKVAKKKLIITTTTVIDGQKKDGQVLPDKVFVKQEIDSYKTLNKDGKDLMGRDCRDSYDAEAQSKVEIAYGYESNAKHQARLAELTEKIAFAAQETKVTPVTAMPTGTPVTAEAAVAAAPVVDVSDDI